MYVSATKQPQLIFFYLGSPVLGSVSLTRFSLYTIRTIYDDEHTGIVRSEDLHCALSQSNSIHSKPITVPRSWGAVRSLVGIVGNNDTTFASYVSKHHKHSISKKKKFIACLIMGCQVPDRPRPRQSVSHSVIQSKTYIARPRNGQPQAGSYRKRHGSKRATYLLRPTLWWMVIW